MPSRYARSRFAIVASLLGAVAAAQAQELKFPTDSVAEAAVPPVPTELNDTTFRSAGTPGPIGAEVFSPDDVPFTVSEGGLYFNPALGAHLRAEYRTRSYGQQEGTFNLGTLKLFDLDGGVAFLDGQVTLNDESGVGYNVGAGYRWLSTPLLPWSVDDQKITGVSIWSDGQTIDRELFFPQIGVSYELLGERFDFRANGYFPIGPRTRDEDFVVSSETVFLGNSLIDGQTSFNRTTSLTLGEAELAGRIADLDAWVFGGVYGFNSPDVDAVGGKIGLRGYATPDLLLSIALSNDDEFDTNALFSATWFIGRTRVENAPRGVLTDRFREPVIRNTYVATQQRQVVENNDAIAATFVHVDSTAAAGGDGTFEAPLNSLAALGANSGENDTIVVHADSTFSSDTATLQNGQTLLGEGGGTALSVTVAGNAVTLPETAAGALTGALPTIDGGAASAITLANDNTVQNFTVSGGTQAVDATGASNPTIENITVTAGAGGFLLDSVAGTASITNSSFTGATTAAISATGGSADVSIDNVSVTDGVGGFLFDNTTGATTVANSTLANTTNAAVGVTDGTGDVSIDNLTVTGTEGVQLSNVSGTTTVANSSLTDATAAAVNVTNGDGDVSIDNVTVANGVSGFLFDNTTGAATVTNSTLANTTNAAVGVTDATGDVSIDNLTLTGTDGVQLSNVSGATTVANSLLGGTTNSAVSATGGSGDVSINNVSVVAGGGGFAFDGQSGTASVVDSALTGTTGPAVSVSGGTGLVTVDSLSTITDTVGTAIDINGNGGAVTIDADVTTGPTVDGGGVVIVNNQAAVTLNGALDANNDTALSITDAAQAVTASGAINHDGTGDAVAVVDTGVNTAVGVAIAGDITNTGGRSVFVDGSNDIVSVTGMVDDDGTGVRIEDLAATGQVDFADLVTVNTSIGDAISLANNDASSIVSFGPLIITTTNGEGLVSDGGVVNVDGIDPLNNDLSGTLNSITTAGDTAIRLTGGSSTQGVAFGSVTTGTVTDDSAIVLTGFDGLVTVNGGTLATTGGFDTVTVTDTDFAIDGATLTSDTGITINALYNSATNRTLEVANVTASTGANRAFEVDIAGDGDVTFLLDSNDFENNLTGAGSQTAFINISGGTGTSNATVANNTFSNENGFGADGFEIVTNSAGATLNLSISGNTATVGPADTPTGNITVTENAGTFGVFQRDTADADNTPGVIFTGDINDFDNLLVAPPTP